MGAGVCETVSAGSVEEVIGEVVVELVLMFIEDVVVGSVRVIESEGKREVNEGGDVDVAAVVEVVDVLGGTINVTNPAA